ncbi:hypothetical protein [Brevundimonas sp. DC300-4]|uniref:hypothetical protein n=1 Tax=Brevundimonas sp. DC300-4 TaxID=2804594 RepID=UPI003CEDE441
MADRIIIARAPDRVIVGPSTTRVLTPPSMRIVTGARGRPGINGAGFEFVQNSPSADWIVNHNLGFRPTATVLSAGGVEVLAEVVHASTNQLRVIFPQPQTGSVRCI